MTRAIRQPDVLSEDVTPTAASDAGQERRWANEAWRTLGASGRRDKLPEGLDAIWHAGVGRLGRLAPRTRLLLRRAKRVAKLHERVRDLGREALRGEIERTREGFARGVETTRCVDEAMALVREAARRQLGLEPYPVQIAAALGGVRGYLLEMATGEGKTLSAAMIAAVAGWRGKGCHVLTVNDYLARRDAEELRPLYAALGLSVAHVEEAMEPPRRRLAYRADVTYATNKEIAGDFLRDRVARGGCRDANTLLLSGLMGRARSGEGVLLRGLEQAIVDEADSILIDEAVTPLILSAEAPPSAGQAAEDFQRSRSLAERLEAGRHFKVDAKHRDVELSAAGRRRLNGLCRGLTGLWRSPRLRNELVSRALTAERLFHRDQHYVIHESKVVIVDESTGRLMPDRTWRDGLHQAVEVKEGLEPTAPQQTLDRISFQRFFRRYRRLTGMTGTALEERAELWQVYRLPTIRIPTHRPCVRKQLADRVFPTAEAKWDAVIREVRRVHQTDRPVLVGTRSVEASETLSRRLTELDLPHAVLNAVYHEHEAAVVAEAGRRGTITVATNMAGRGTDIKLGPGVADLGGLHVIATERHEAARVDRQLFGRAARQGDPGSAVAHVSMEDELVRRHARGSLRARLLRHARPGLSFAIAQSRAQRLARRQRKAVLKQDQSLSEQLGFAGIER